MTDSLQPAQNNPTIDDIIEESLESFGWAQAFQSILVAFASLFDAQNSFISVFTNAQPTFHCIDNTLCNSSSNICEIPKFAWALSDRASKTIISEWELQCSSSFIQVTGILPAFSSNIWMYVIIRFFSGLGRGSLVTCTVVLLTERVGRNWQGRVGILDHLFFSYGTLFLPVLAFSTRRYSWRVLYLCTGIPVSVYCVIAYHLVVESPRLLFMRGYTEEAITALRQIS
ncbi:hypothetical protein QUC31_002270 [Theobroma cacao]